MIDMSEELHSLAQSGSEPEKAVPPLSGRYQIKGVLGAGAMGVVYAGFDLQLQRPVAIKLLQFQGSRDKNLQERLFREARTLLSLSHPNIVSLYHWGLAENGEIFLVMELVEGNSLACEIGAGGTLSPSRFYSIFVQVLSGLAHAHKQGVVHRDLKPSNIIVSTDKEGNPLVKIIDFGIASLESRDAPDSPDSSALTRTGSLLGSPLYMSPEQCRGNKVDRLSDIYSLAAVMYEALTASPPFQGETAMEIMYKHLKEKPPGLDRMLGKGVLQDLGRLIDSCLEKDSSLRPQSAEEISERLDKLFENKVDTGSLVLAPASSRKKIKVVVAGASLLVILLFSFALLLKPNSRQGAQEAEELENKINLNQKKSKYKHIEIMKKQADTLLREYRQQIGEQEKLDLGGRYLRLLCEVSYEYIKAGDYKLAEETIMETLPILPEIDKRSNLNEVNSLSILAECKIGQNKLKDASEIIEKASKLSVGSLDSRADLQLTIFKLRIAEHDFKGAQAAFAAMNDLLETRDQHRAISNRTLSKFSKQSMAPALLKRVKRILSETPVLDYEQLSKSERLAVLSLYQHIAVKVIDLRSQLAGQVLSLCKKIQKSGVAEADSKEFRQAASLTDSLIARYESEVPKSFKHLFETGDEQDSGASGL